MIKSMEFLVFYITDNEYILSFKFVFKLLKMNTKWFKTIIFIVHTINV